MNDSTYPSGLEVDPFRDSAEQAADAVAEYDLDADDADSTEIPTWEDAISSLLHPLNPPKLPLAKEGDDR